MTAGKRMRSNAKSAPFKTIQGTVIENCVHQSYLRGLSLSEAFQVFISWLSVITDLFQTLHDLSGDLLQLHDGGGSLH